MTCVNVTENALIKFIEHVTIAGGIDIKVSIGGGGWYVTYRSPFTREVKCSAQEIAEADCEGDIAKCGDKYHSSEEVEGW